MIPIKLFYISLVCVTLKLVFKIVYELSPKKGKERILKTFLIRIFLALFRLIK